MAFLLNFENSAILESPGEAIGSFVGASSCTCKRASFSFLSLFFAERCKKSEEQHRRTHQLPSL